MKQLTKKQRVAVIRCLVEGCSIRSTVRITGVAKNTIQKLTREMGEAALAYQDDKFRGLACERIQCDEIWNFCYCKEKNVPDAMRGCTGRRLDLDLDRDVTPNPKLILSWRLGARDAANANAFMMDVSERVGESFPANDRRQQSLLRRGTRSLRPVHRLRDVGQNVWSRERREPLQPCQVSWGEAASRSGASRTPTTFRPALSNGRT